MLWPFEYFRPTSREEVSKLLSEFDGARILAGGTNLIIDMEMGVIRPDHVIDVKKVDGLDALEKKKPDAYFIGAAVPINRLADCADEAWECLRQCIPLMATCQVRNRATVVGNLCNGSPAADLAPPLLVLGTKVCVRGSDNAERSIALEDFFAGVKKTTLSGQEWVTGLEVPVHGAMVRTSFRKKQRVRGHDLAIVNVAGLCSPEAKQLRVAVGACAVTPLLFQFDDVYSKAKGLDDVVKPVMSRILEGIKPISDVRSSAEYRRDMVEHLAKQVLAEIYC